MDLERKHAAIIIALAAGIIVGILAQRTRLCMVGGIRDAVLFKEYKLLFGFAAILVTALVMNLILGAVTGTSYFNPGFAGQPIAHTDGLWNALGMYLAGFGCILLGGCPLRQLILAGEGNTDSAVTVLGLMAGAAFAHNFGLASSGEGPTANWKDRSYYWDCGSCCNCGSELHEKRRSLIVGMQTLFQQSIRSLCGK